MASISDTQSSSDFADLALSGMRDGGVDLSAVAESPEKTACAFIAVDATRRTAGDHGTSIPVPVPVPEGTRYETTVEN